MEPDFQAYLQLGFSFAVAGFCLRALFTDIRNQGALMATLLEKIGDLNMRIVRIESILERLREDRAEKKEDQSDGLSR